MDATLFWWNDYFSSPKVQGMDLAEQGAYIRLLGRMWQDPTCSLPADDVALAGITELGPQWYKPSRDKAKRWEGKTSGEKLRACCFVQDGRIFNARLLKEWNRAREKSAERSRCGAIGNQRKAELRAKNQTFSQVFPQKMHAVPNGGFVSSQQDSVENATQKRSQTDRILSLSLEKDISLEEREKEKEREVPAKKLPSLDVPNTTEPQSYAGPHDSAQRSIRTPSPVLEENWFAFRGKFTEVSVPATEEQWAAAHHVWRIMDPGQRKASTDFLDTPGAQDPEYFKVSKSSPATFLRNRIWTLPVPQRKKCSSGATAPAAQPREDTYAIWKARQDAKRAAIEAEATHAN